MARDTTELDAAHDEACARLERNDFDSMSERDKILVAVRGLEGEVNNGGFDQYYFNGASDLALFAPIALEAIGAKRMASIVRRANAAFGPGGPPSNMDARHEQLLRLTSVDARLFDDLDAEFCGYPEDISELLLDYLARKAGDV